MLFIIFQLSHYTCCIWWTRWKEIIRSLMGKKDHLSSFSCKVQMSKKFKKKKKVQMSSRLHLRDERDIINDREEILEYGALLSIERVQHTQLNIASTILALLYSNKITFLYFKKKPKRSNLPLHYPKLSNFSLWQTPTIRKKLWFSPL